MGNKRRKPEIHDIWADALVCDVSASVVLRGPQDADARTGEDARGRHVVVRVGRVLVYLYGQRPIASHAEAWKRAKVLATKAFPEHYAAQPPRKADDDDRPLTVGSVVLQLDREQRPVRVDAATTAAAALPYVQVQVGRLIVVCLDLASVQSAESTWSSAKELAEEWLTNPDAAADRRRSVAAFERRGRSRGRAASGQQQTSVG